jgi:hypothetical protein
MEREPLDTPPLSLRPALYALCSSLDLVVEGAHLLRFAELVNVGLVDKSAVCNKNCV